MTKSCTKHHLPARMRSHPVSLLGGGSQGGLQSGSHPSCFMSGLFLQLVTPVRHLRLLCSHLYPDHGVIACIASFLTSYVIL